MFGCVKFWIYLYAALLKNAFWSVCPMNLDDPWFSAHREFIPPHHGWGKQGSSHPAPTWELSWVRGPIYCLHSCRQNYLQDGCEIEQVGCELCESLFTCQKILEQNEQSVHGINNLFTTFVPKRSSRESL